MPTNGKFHGRHTEKPMAIDSSSDAARGEPPGPHESKCVDGRDGTARLML